MRKNHKFFCIINPVEFLSLEYLKKNKSFLENIRWDVTPRNFFPRTPSDREINVTHGYMLYVEIFKDKPVLMVMRLKYERSETVGYIKGVPEDLLQEALHCTAPECIAGMYPLTEKLESWLKKELGLS